MAQNYSIGFSLVNIPIKLTPAIQESGISFNQLHFNCMARVKYKKVCSDCGQELSADEIVKGFEYKKGHYVIIAEEELEGIKFESDRLINIEKFIPANIDPLYYDKTYYVTPNGADKPYELLRSTLYEMNKFALGRAVFGNQQRVVALRATEAYLFLTMLYYQSEVKTVSLPSAPIKIQQEEKRLAETIVSNLEGQFDPSEYTDEYSDRLMSAIQRKIAGQAMNDRDQEVDAEGGNIVDLMEALQQSIIKTNKPTVKKGGRRRKTGTESGSDTDE